MLRKTQKEERNSCVSPYTAYTHNSRPILDFLSPPQRQRQALHLLFTVFSLKMDGVLVFLVLCGTLAPALSALTPPATFLPSNPYTTTPATPPQPTTRAATTIKPSVMRHPPQKASNIHVYTCSGTYLLTVPQKAIPGFNFTLGYESFVDRPVELHARIYEMVNDGAAGRYPYPTVVTATGSFVKGQPGLLDLPLPSNLRQGNYYWEMGCNDCDFLPSTNYNDYAVHTRKHYVSGRLNVAYDITTILVQTDKAIYKPGQLVHYRVFAVYSDLRMYTGKFQIEVSDPNGNKIQRLSEVSGTQGVVEGSLGLADKPLFGDWTISVQIQTTTRSDSYSKKFSVQEYTLPRFEVNVDVPSYVLLTDEDVKGSVKATYTFGQPVKGMVELHVSSMAGLYYCGKEPPFMQIAFDIDGEAKFSVPRVDISRVVSTYDGSQIKITAIVKETLTDVKLQGSAVVTYRSTPYKVTILDNTPGVFKPGLPFSVFAKASMQDDSPVAGSTTMTIFTTAHYNVSADNSFLYGVSQFTGTYPLPVRTIDVPPSGVVKIDIDIPSNATSLDVTVDFKGVTAIKNIYKMFSVSNNYLQLTLLDKNLKSGQTARIQAKATEPIGRLWYQVLSRGIVYEAATVDAKGQHVLVINIPVTPDLAPTAHMMAYYVRPDLEIVADSIAFNVDGIFKNEVTLELSTNKSEPHTDLDVYLTADPDSMVYLLAVDQSVLLMKTGNDVTPDEASVADAAASYSVGKKPSDSEFALSLSQQNIAGTIQQTGCLLMKSELSVCLSLFTCSYDVVPTVDSHKNQPLQEVERVRNLFPETWLWLNQTVGRNGSATIHTTVPDTITSWITTAFATNLQSGLGITSSAAKVLVTLPASHEYSSVVITSDGSEAIDSGDQERAVTVKSNEQAVVYFPIIPTALGAIDIEVSARSTLAADAERRQLNVEAEGVPNEFSIPVFINLGPNGSDTFTQTFPITVPSDVVEGSSRSRVKITGDILGPSVDGLDTLLRMPTGCGEQNMIRMAPNLYVSNYLKATGQMTSDLGIRIKNLLETGITAPCTSLMSDRESLIQCLTRTPALSLWIVPFQVDGVSSSRAMDWLIQRQNTDGSFNEFGHIFDPQMKKFGDHSTGLTAFVLLALVENSDVPSTKAQMEAYTNATSRALHFLETTHANIADDLSLALTTLTLVKARSPAADVAFAKLMSHSITEHGMTFWKSNETLAINAYSHWRPAYVRARPIDIHVTSYALLVFAAKGLFQEGMSVLHWLTRQRNPYGGFASTQDTMVGLQAMTEFLKEATLSGSDLHLDVRTEHTVPHFDISSTNSLVLQAKELSFIPSQVTFEASGRGVAVAELDVFFNSESDFGEPAFGVSTVLMDDYLNSFKIMICTRWLSAGESGMVVQEVGIPSGFAPDMTSIGNVAGLKRVEQRGRFLDVYIDKVTKNSLCYTVMFDRQDKVAHSQPSYVITQDYYEPSNRATTTYLPTSLRDAAPEMLPPTGRGHGQGPAPPMLQTASPHTFGQTTSDVRHNVGCEREERNKAGIGNKRLKMDGVLVFLVLCGTLAPAHSALTPPATFLPSNPYTTTPATPPQPTTRAATTVKPSVMRHPPQKASNRHVYTCSGTYLLTVPQKAIPGFNFTLGYESFVDRPVELHARIYEMVYDGAAGRYAYPTVVTATGSFVKGQPGLLDLPLPSNLRQGNYYWEMGCNDCDFLPSTNYNDYAVHTTKYYVSGGLNVAYDITTILVQTDKAIYKPGQLVHYRVFAVYPDLRMYTGKFQIEVSDPNGNKIQRLSEVSGTQGVVEGSLGLADKPLFGDWTISVQIQTTTRSDSYSKKFSVQEYTLPRFEVNVDVPSYVLLTDEDVKGSVKATYTFGQPVKGMVELHVSSMAGLDYCGKEPPFMQIAFDIDGEAKFSVPRVDISRVVSTYDGSQIKITAIVKETLTDVKLQGSAVVTYRSTPYKVTILDNTPGVFKPGLPFSVFAKASMQDDSPVAGATTMTIFTTAHYNIPADNSFLYGVSQFTGTYPLPVRTIDVPPSGVVKIDIDIPSNATSLDVTVDFKGVKASKNINKMFSISNNYLQLTLLDNNLKVVLVTFSIHYINCQCSHGVLSRGLVYEATSVDAKGQHVMVIDIPVTPDLAPTAHMMAYYVRPDLEIVADSIAFNVDGVFENEARTHFRVHYTNKSEPHTDLDVYLTADPDSMVYLLAVDQSVLLMKTGNDVTPDEASVTSLCYCIHTALSCVFVKIKTQRNFLSDSVIVFPVQVAEAAASYSVGTKPSDSAFALSLSQRNIAGTIQVTTVTGDRFSGGAVNDLKNQPLQEVERVRNLFPETWLWLNQTVGSDGSATIHTTVPDTITSWITTAFATNLQSGLGITSSAAKVLVTLPASHEYSSVVIGSDGSEVKSNEQAVVYFPIIPTALGAIDIEVSARSTLAADAERRQLNVEATRENSLTKDKMERLVLLGTTIIQAARDPSSITSFEFIIRWQTFGDHSSGLTAFVLLALLENADVPLTIVQREAYNNATSRALHFLETTHANIADDLSLALTTLTLVKARSPAADVAFAKLMSHSITERTRMTFWKSNETLAINAYSHWRPAYVRARPIDIHVTSYALLVFAAKGLFQEGMSVLHWLTRQRNPYGGFASTQDTIVGLQAMTEFLKEASPSGLDLHLDVRTEHTAPHFDVTSANSLVLQAKELSFIPSQVTFEASGKGVAVAEVAVCWRKWYGGAGGGIPSGFAPDMTSIGNVAGLKRVEQRGRFLDVYIDKITKNSLCYTVMFDRQDKVAHSQPSYVITQDYYEPSNRATTTYLPMSLRDASVCDVCRDCC
ncbi:hypothetical protein C0Q70_06412 [Pomacea canaliculata]|uniref:NTR domain-containing protein n=1 Tax=Pomacea canaliculata TaxID=400727 RepID=A0A2T7PNY6_POMCA|nr:hypothetical protein C0Q70_06412 [Pomacea canaliculata]